jgi:hypothetical protein
MSQHYHFLDWLGTAKPISRFFSPVFHGMRSAAATAGEGRAAFVTTSM